jgi:uncharacterized protein (TIGR02186 family)
MTPPPGLGRHLPRCIGGLLLVAMLLGARPPAAAAQAIVPPSLAAELSVSRIEVSTAFTGGEILVFGATERLIHAGGDEIAVLVTGPVTSLVVRQKIAVLGFWINGPSARFNRVPSYWALAGTRPVAEMVSALDRAELRLGLDMIQLPQLGAGGAQFREALRELKQREGRWVDQQRPVAVSGGRLFHARLPVPSTVETGTYRVQVLLLREGRVVARQELSLEVERVGTAARIADVAGNMPILYGVACILLAALAGWLGSVLFRRG